jgi:hypothetical protein
MPNTVTVAVAASSNVSGTIALTLGSVGGTGAGADVLGSAVIKKAGVIRTPAAAAAVLSNADTVPAARSEASMRSPTRASAFSDTVPAPRRAAGQTTAATAREAASAVRRGCRAARGV